MAGLYRSRLLRGEQMRGFEKFYTVFYILAGWVAVRFFLTDMKDIPDLLAFAGMAFVVYSIVKKKYSLARMASIGYVVSYLIGALFATDGLDAGGGRTNNLWIIWVVSYVILLLLGAYIEKKRVRALQNQKRK